MTEPITTAALAARLHVSRVTIVRDLHRLNLEPRRILNGARLLEPDDVRAITEFRRLRQDRREGARVQSTPAGGTA